MLVDLPTASGKTDIIIIWLLALAWAGLQPEDKRPAIPRRLIRVINRRVLILQDKRVIDILFQRIAEPDLAEVRRGLAVHCAALPDGNLPLQVVELRGQLYDDRKWSENPTVPSVIIGTVDMVGSRLFFCGYGLGRSVRPYQAALMGIDSWICIDEAHLVPAFVHTVRQVVSIIKKDSIRNRSDQWMRTFVPNLPTWYSELSATPAGGCPSPDRVSSGSEQDAGGNEVFAERWHANSQKEIRLIKVTTKELTETIAKLALDYKDKQAVVAVYSSTVKQINDIEATIQKGLDRSTRQRILKITGRMRGYERDRLFDQPLSHLFLAKRRDRGASVSDEARRYGKPDQTVYLMGTSAAEVGVDSDADALVCDFAALDTLIQRLGRLDRLGLLGKDGKMPTMTIVVTEEELKNAEEHLNNAWEIAQNVGESLSLTVDETSRPSLISSSFWPAFAKDKVNKNIDDIVLAATLASLLGLEKEKNDARKKIKDQIPRDMPCIAVSADDWGAHPLAPVAIKPILGQPLTEAVLDCWSATTDPVPPYLQVHAWLYGLGQSETNTPLVDIVFRLELDILQQQQESDELDNRQNEDALKSWKSQADQVLQTLKQFPPCGTEGFGVPLYNVRPLFEKNSPLKDTVCLLRQSGEWRIFRFGIEDLSIAPGTLILLPTKPNKYPSWQEWCKKYNKKEYGNLKDAIAEGPELWGDVLSGAWVEPSNAAYRRIIERPSPEDNKSKLKKKKTGDAALLRLEEQNGGPIIMAGKIPAGNVPDTQWTAAHGPANDFARPRFRLTLQLGKECWSLAYCPANRNVHSTEAPFPLAEHQRLVCEYAKKFCQAVSPGNPILQKIMQTAAIRHDDGKTHMLWQSWAGNHDPDQPVSKPIVKQGRSSGLRHEWVSMLSLLLFDNLAKYADLISHLVGSHHGYLRPNLPKDKIDPIKGTKQQKEDIIVAACRWHDLQQRIGRWHLAYLEMLLKASDIAGSNRTYEEDDNE